VTIDPSALAELLEMVGDDSAFVDEIVETYLRDAPEQVAGMRAALAAGDLVTLGRHAHTLKGNSLSVGAPALAAIARDLEERARAGDVADAGPRIEDASAELGRVATALEAARLRGWRP
jgi:HPt (histidine-containing phosphotransfer) domain-containing protein